MSNLDSPWGAAYKRMHEELPENDIERNTLLALAEGKALSECFTSFWEPNGFSYKDFNAFYKKASEWETEHLCASVNKKTVS